VITLCREKLAEQQAEGLERLESQAAQFEAEGDFDGAIALWREYAGPHAATIRGLRFLKVEALKARHAEAAGRQAAEAAAREEAARREAASQMQRAREQALIETLLTSLLEEGVAAAKALADARALESPDLLASEAVLPYRTLISGASEAEQTLLQSFTESIGRDLELQTRSGKIAGRLISVSRSTGDLFLSRLQGGTRVQFVINVRDLALQDRLARMGTGDAPGLRLARALHALDQGAYDYVRAQARALPEALQQRLLEKIPPGR
jgi:hypothetical protein